MELTSKHIAVALAVVLVAVFALGCTSSPKTIGGDKDEHGCLIAAGYSWCPSTQKCQRMWEEYCTEYAEQYRGNESAAVQPAQPVNHTVAANMQKCMQYCIELNKDSSIRSVGSWFVDKPNYCTYGCEASGIDCSVTFFNSAACTVHCDNTSIARCS